MADTGAVRRDEPAINLIPMSKAAQLKKKASEFEQKRQYDRALATYIQAIEASSGSPDEIDIPLYNRVGDLHLRLGDLEQAVAYYEMAVDLYSEGGFFNNAIALCNKVLRHSPSRASIYYKLGKISARKGFTSDAKQNFLEYADRMQKAGDSDEAFRALKEFADLCTGQDDVRLMLADQLARAGRNPEALEQLQIVHDTMVAEGRDTEASATLERMRGIDPSVEPKRGLTQPRQKHDGLVFIDVDYEAPANAGSLPKAVDIPQPVKFSEVVEHPILPGVEFGGERPLTAEEFGAQELPPAADVHVQGTLDSLTIDSPLSGIHPVDDPIGGLTPTLAVETIDSFDSTIISSPESIVDEPTSFVADAGGAPLEGLTTGFDGHNDPLGALSSHVETPSSPFGDDAVESLLPPDDTETLELAPPDPALIPGFAPLELEGAALNELAPTELESAELDPAIERSEDITAPAEPVSGVEREDDYFVDLQEWLLETEPPKNPRMTAADEAEGEDNGAVQTDFSEMLDTFKRGIAQNVDESDSESHYDLGVAYMEMGLVDEAIEQFQKVIRFSDATSDRRVRAYESLGQCFIERQQYGAATASLARALTEKSFSDDTLVGVLFLLGYAAESERRWNDALTYYQRVYAVDIHFRDVTDRLARVQAALEGSA